MSTICVYSGPKGLSVEQETKGLYSCFAVKMRKLHREIASAAVQAPSQSTARLLSDIDTFRCGKISASITGLMFTIERDADGFYIFKADATHWSIRYYAEHDSEYVRNDKPTNKLLMRMERDEKRAKNAFDYDNAGK